MKKLLILAAIILTAIVLSACGTKTYKITTTAGQEYFSEGSPEYNVTSKTYTFKDGAGNEIVLNKDDIKGIKEQ